MAALVVYDSTYGNTTELSEAIGPALGPGSRVLPLANVSWEEVSVADLVVVGSPTQGGRPTTALKQFIDSWPAAGIAGKRVAAFDTRLDARSQNVALRLLMSVIGYAAPRTLGMLKSRGGIPIAPPEAFFVEGTEGPLRQGELERAAAWARRLGTG